MHTERGGEENRGAYLKTVNLAFEVSHFRGIAGGKRVLDRLHSGRAPRDNVIFGFWFLICAA